MIATLIKKKKLWVLGIVLICCNYFFTREVIYTSNNVVTIRERHASFPKSPPLTNEETNNNNNNNNKNDKTTTNFATPGTNEFYATHINNVQTLCGDLCTMYDFSDIPAEILINEPQKQTFPLEGFKQYLQKKKAERRKVQINCANLFSAQAVELFDAPGRVWPPPLDFPPSLKPYYSNNGQIATGSKIHLERQAGHLIRKWEKSDMENLIHLARQDQLPESYGIEQTRAVRKYLTKHLEAIKGRKGLIVGTQYPWMEALVLHLGADEVTTLEYAKIVSNHPKMKTILPEEIASLFQNGETKPSYDFVLSFSSIEHSGLGRYGDELNPFGDVIACARISCLLKSGGVFFLGLPIEKKPVTDIVLYNEARFYGTRLLARLTSGFEVEDAINPVEPESHGFLLLRKP